MRRSIPNRSAARRRRTFIRRTRLVAQHRSRPDLGALHHGCSAHAPSRQLVGAIDLARPPSRRNKLDNLLALTEPVPP